MPDQRTDQRPPRETTNEIVVHPHRNDLIPSLVPFYDFWRNQCGGVLPIPASKLAPEVVPPALLPHMSIMEVLPGGSDYRFRFVGAEIAKILGRDSTGKRFSEVDYPPAARERTSQYFEAVTGAGLPIWARDRGRWFPTLRVAVAALLLPASTDGKTIDLVVLALDAYPES